MSKGWCKHRVNNTGTTWNPDYCKFHKQELAASTCDGCPEHEEEE